MKGPRAFGRYVGFGWEGSALEYDHMGGYWEKVEIVGACNAAL